MAAINALEKVGSKGNLASSSPKDLILPYLSIASNKYNCLNAYSIATDSGLSRKSNPSISEIPIYFSVKTIDVKFTLLISGWVIFGNCWL